MTDIEVWCGYCAEFQPAKKMTVVYGSVIYDLACGHQMEQKEVDDK